MILLKVFQNFITLSHACILPQRIVLSTLTDMCGNWPSEVSISYSNRPLTVDRFSHARSNILSFLSDFPSRFQLLPDIARLDIDDRLTRKGRDQVECRHWQLIFIFIDDIPGGMGEYEAYKCFDYVLFQIRNTEC